MLCIHNKIGSYRQEQNLSRTLKNMYISLHDYSNTSSCRLLPFQIHSHILLTQVVTSIRWCSWTDVGYHCCTYVRMYVCECTVVVETSLPVRSQHWLRCFLHTGCDEGNSLSNYHRQPAWRLVTMKEFFGVSTLETQLIHVCSCADDYSGTRKDQLAIIACTNEELFDRMVEVTRLHPQARLGFAGKIQSYGFGMLLDRNRLLTGKEIDRITHPFVHRFRSFQREVAEEIGDVSLLGKIAVGCVCVCACVRVWLSVLLSWPACFVWLQICRNYRDTLPEHISTTSPFFSSNDSLLLPPSSCSNHQCQSIFPPSRADQSPYSFCRLFIFAENIHVVIVMWPVGMSCDVFDRFCFHYWTQEQRVGVWQCCCLQWFLAKSGALVTFTTPGALYYSNTSIWLHQYI